MHTLDPTKRPRAIRTRLRKSGLSLGHKYAERVRRINKSASFSDFSTATAALRAAFVGTTDDAAGVAEVEADLDWICWH